MVLLNAIVGLINDNPAIFLIVFIISLLANLIQIYTFFRDRRRLREELAEKAKLANLVDTYEYILNLAQKNIKTEEQLAEVEQKISQKVNFIGEMEARVQTLQQAAQRQLVSQALERNLTVLLQTYEDISKLRAEYASLGELPDIPESKRREIEEQVSIALKRPYEFPKSFAFKSILLVLFIFLLPWPVDTFLIVIFLPVFLGTFFEAVTLYQQSSFKEWVVKNANRIGLVSAFGAWLSLFNALGSVFFEPLDVVLTSFSEQVYSLTYTSPLTNLLRVVMSARWSIIDTLSVILSIIFAFVHWRAIRRSTLSTLRSNQIDGG